jgi:serine phosphatase RsbU (regulator of sigma subunit)
MSGLPDNNIASLASFPEQNPNPVIELSISDGNITYVNPATVLSFPDIRKKNLDHPLFEIIKKKLSEVPPEYLNNLVCEVSVNELIFEQKMFYIKARNVLRIYASDITLQKKNERKLASLALFPEQNPNPVIEVDLQKGQITYSNPAALKYFPDLKKKQSEHPLFNSIMKQLSRRKDFQCEVVIDDHIFEQKIYFIENSEYIRVYSTDITERKETEKNLLRLASFPEQNPSPIIEIDLERNITYFNPACANNFPEFEALKLAHPVMKPMEEFHERLKNKEIDNYSVELKIGERYFTQRGRFLPKHGVIRVFNLDITQQKESEELIREKNKDITDSINYARKIQQAILPSEDLLLKTYPDSFVLYKPKDIISGDFYWYHPTEKHLLFACADCTGHGVPGALMSMIGSNIIGHIIHEKEIIAPEDALLELDKRIRKSLKQDEEPESRDGMDISFCSLEHKKMLLRYAGANRPLAIIRNGELIEHAPSKFPIGGQFNADKQFAGNSIQLKKNDRIYLFTDGITDQFGGPLGKKLMKKRFYSFLVEISQMSMQEQKEKIFAFFSGWKGELEQVDDVLVMGIRI